MIHDVITAPVLTERSRQLELTGVYTFVVHPEATKDDIKAAFEKLYGQTPTSIRIAKNHEKVRFAKKGTMRKRARIKKAYVALPKPITNIAKTTVK